MDRVFGCHEHATSAVDVDTAATDVDEVVASAGEVVVADFVVFNEVSGDATVAVVLLVDTFSDFSSFAADDVVVVVVTVVKDVSGVTAVFSSNCKKFNREKEKNTHIRRNNKH